MRKPSRYHKQLRVRVHPEHDPDKALKGRNYAPLFDVVVRHVAYTDFLGYGPDASRSALLAHQPDEFGDIEQEGVQYLFSPSLSLFFDAHNAWWIHAFLRLLSVLELDQSLGCGTTDNNRMRESMPPILQESCSISTLFFRRDKLQ